MPTQVTLNIGADPPDNASIELYRALREVQVTRANSAPAAFQLTFGAVRYDPRYDADEEDETDDDEDSGKPYTGDL